MKLVPGLGGGERAMAMRRGETQSTVAGIGQVLKNTDVMQPLVLTNKDPKLPDVPAVSEVALKGKEKWAKWAAAWDEVIYWAYSSPGVPEDKLAFLEEALKKTYNDPGFRADVQKAGFELSPAFVGRKELTALSADLAKLTDAEIEEMKIVITQKYMKK